MNVSPEASNICMRARGEPYEGGGLFMSSDMIKDMGKYISRLPDDTNMFSSIREWDFRIG